MNKKIDIKYFYLAIGICVILGSCLFLRGHDNSSSNKIKKETKDEEVVTAKDIEEPYDKIFNSFTGVMQVMDVDKTVVDKSYLTQDDELNIITQLITKDDYTESKEKADFNEELAKYRTIKKATLEGLLKNYFDDQFTLPDNLFIFPYDYTLTGDSYIGEAIITGIIGEPGWQYEPVSYTLSKSKLTITGFAYYDDFYEGRMCADELCNKVVDGANYNNILDYKDSFVKITVNFERNGKVYKFMNITKGE